jgi:hypothetical protein
MSADEKRKAILDIYHKTKSVFTEKELVTLATKAGVNSNTYVSFHLSFPPSFELRQTGIRVTRLALIPGVALRKDRQSKQVRSLSLVLLL